MIARGLEDRRQREAAGLPEPTRRGGAVSQVIESGATRNQRLDHARQQAGSYSQVIESGAISIMVRDRNGDMIGRRIAAAVEKLVREGEEATARAVERRLAEIQSQMKSQRTK